MRPGGVLRTEGLGLPPPLHHPAVHLVAAGCLGAALGASVLRFSPVLVLAALAGGLLALLVLRRPEVGLLGIVVATSTVLASDALPPVSMGIGSLLVPDVILLALLGVIVVRKLAERDFRVLDSPLSAPLLALFGIALLSTFVGVAQGSVPISAVVREGRILSYYLTFFIVIALVREARQINLLVGGLLLLATAVAVTMIAQAAAGDTLRFLPGRTEVLETQDVVYSGVTRVLPPGQSLVLAGFLLALTVLLVEPFGPSKLARFFQAGLLGAAVLLTFNRSFWVAVILALGILALVADRPIRQRGVGWAIFALAAAVAILLPLSGDEESPPARAASAAIDRLETLTSEQTIGESSLQFRYVENSYAIPQILSHPLVGLGLGASYRPLLPDLDYGDDRTNYIHNGHFWVMLKAGPLGYLALVWASVLFLSRSFRHWREAPEPRHRAIVLAFALIYVGVLVGSIVNPMLSQVYWAPVIGIMMGVSEVILAGPLRRSGAAQWKRPGARQASS